MHYDLNEVKNYTKFLTDCLENSDYFTSKDVENFVDAINCSTIYIPDFTYDIGATKMVIIPFERDYVIKIAFNGSWSYDGNFYPFTKAETDNGDDYCEVEMNIYLNAIDAGFDHLLAPIEFLYKEGPTSVYIQPKVEMLIQDDFKQQKYTSLDSINKIKSMSKEDDNCFFSLPYSWQANCLDQLEGSVEQLKEFVKFLKDYSCFYDMHIGNVGYYNHKAVIIDYGGYRD